MPYFPEGRPYTPQDLEQLDRLPFVRTYLSSFDEPYFDDPIRWLEDLEKHADPLLSSISDKCGPYTLDAMTDSLTVVSYYSRVLNRKFDIQMQRDSMRSLILLGYEPENGDDLKPFHLGIVCVMRLNEVINPELEFSDFSNALNVVNGALAGGAILRQMGRPSYNPGSLDIFRDFINGDEFHTKF